MTIGCVHDGVAQYARGEFLDERRNSVRLSLICLLDLSRQRILHHHRAEHWVVVRGTGDVGATKAVKLHKVMRATIGPSVMNLSRTPTSMRSISRPPKVRAQSGQDNGKLPVHASGLSRIWHSLGRDLRAQTA
jgi:hypothetical protein